MNYFSFKFTFPTSNSNKKSPDVNDNALINWVDYPDAVFCGGRVLNASKEAEIARAGKMSTVIGLYLYYAIFRNIVIEMTKEFRSAFHRNVKD